MSQYILYVDDSGTKEYSPSPEDYGEGNSRYFVFGGVLMSDVESGRLVERIIQIKKECFGTDSVEIKSNWLRIPHERESRYLGPFGLTEERLAEFVEQFYVAIAERDLKLIASVVDKPGAQEKYPKDTWYAPAIAYELLLQRAVQEVAPPDRLAVVVDDMTGATPRGNQYKKNLKNHHAALRKFGSRLQATLDFSSLGSKLRFLNSSLSHQIQVADVVAYNVYRQFTDHGEAWEQVILDEEGKPQSLPTYDWFLRIGPKFRMGPRSRIQGYGVVKFPLEKRVPWVFREDD